MSARALPADQRQREASEQGRAPPSTSTGPHRCSHTALEPVHPAARKAPLHYQQKTEQPYVLTPTSRNHEVDLPSQAQGSQRESPGATSLLAESGPAELQSLDEANRTA